MDKDLMLMIGTFFLTGFVSFLVGFGLGSEAGVEAGARSVVTPTNSGCVVYNNELYCPIFESVEIEV